METDPDCKAGFVNEFGDYTIAVPLAGGKETLDTYMERQELERRIADITEWLLPQIDTNGKPIITFYPRWFQNGWPDAGEISVVPPNHLEGAE